MAFFFLTHHSAVAIARVSHRSSLRNALKVLRSVAASIDAATEGGEWRGFAPPADEWRGSSSSVVPLGVPMAAQLGCYAAAGERAQVEGTTVESAAELAELSATGGARYRPHRDGHSHHPFHPSSIMLPGIAMREITAILYLTEPPPTPDAPVGSPLILYLGAAADDDEGITATRVVEIAPRGGRLVLFDARRVLHEVRPHTRADADRLALTVWLGGAHEVVGCVARTARMLASDVRGAVLGR